MIISMFDVIESLGGNRSDILRVVGNTYEGIEWIGESKFTKEEVEVELGRLKLEQESKKYQELRAAEYPDFRDYLDGIVKGDQNQIEEYIQKCLAVKEKYPKPSES
jgi:hypothetical protein